MTLANLVLAMNCYYSNLIKGHETHPVDNERGVDSPTAAGSRSL
jgi:hypothetical protein